MKGTDKGSAHIFTYYEVFEAEARQMIAGLGKFLQVEYGETTVEDCFSDKYWEGLKEWYWD